MLGKNELDELKRILTNTIGEDRDMMRRIIGYINKADNENNLLKAENKRLKEELEKLTSTESVE